MSFLETLFYELSSGSSEDSSHSGGAFSQTPPTSRSRPSRAITISPELVNGVQARNPQSFRELVHLMYLPLVRFARTIVGSQDDGEDLVQDIFTALWSNGTTWNPGPNPAAYLFTSVRNQALKELRRRGRADRRAFRAQTDSSQAEYGNGIDPTDSVLDRVVEAETDERHRRAVMAVLESCTERQRTAYDLRYHRGLRVPEIAQVLGITPKSAEQLVRRVTHIVMDGLKRER